MVAGVLLIWEWRGDGCWRTVNLGMRRVLLSVCCSFRKGKDTVAGVLLKVVVIDTWKLRLLFRGITVFTEGVSKCTHPLFMHKAPTFSSQGFAIS